MATAAVAPVERQQSALFVRGVRGVRAVVETDPVDEGVVDHQHPIRAGRSVAHPQAKPVAIATEPEIEVLAGVLGEARLLPRGQDPFEAQFPGRFVVGDGSSGAVLVLRAEFQDGQGAERIHAAREQRQYDQPGP